jgi:hypothetical protein
MFFLMGIIGIAVAPFVPEGFLVLLALGGLLLSQGVGMVLWAWRSRASLLAKSERALT